MKKNVLMTAVILLGIMSGCTDSLEQQLAPAAEVETELTTRASSPVEPTVSGRASHHALVCPMVACWIGSFHHADESSFCPGVVKIGCIGI